MRKRPPPIDLHVGMVLTQFGMRTGPGLANFRMAPRPHEQDVSLLAGRLTPRQAAKAVRHGRPEYFPGRDVVRYTTVERLVVAGFRVESTPSPMIPNHISVEYDGDWNDDVAKRFDGCFDPPAKGGGGHG
jgi:hypothetical protein